MIAELLLINVILERLSVVLLKKKTLDQPTQKFAAGFLKVRQLSLPTTDTEMHINPLTPRRTQVFPFTEISIFFK